MLILIHMIKKIECSIRLGKMKDAQDIIMGLWSAGYAATDIIQTLFKVL